MARPGDPLCLGCGTAVTDAIEGATADYSLRSVMRCPACGPVELVVFHDDRGVPVQGFMTDAQLRTLPGYEHDDGAELPF